VDHHVLDAAVLPYRGERGVEARAAAATGEKEKDKQNG